MSIHPLRSASVVQYRPRWVCNHRSRIRLPIQQPARESVDVAGRRSEKLARLEAALWLAEEPLNDKKLATVAELADAAETRSLIDQLRQLLEEDQSSFQIDEVAGGYQLLTRPAFYPWLVRLNRALPDFRLSPALLETLAIIAYRQPIMRAEIENIRGVHCADAIRSLMDRKLIQIGGRHDSLGRPVLYTTTKKFLQTFGLKDLGELPAIENK